ncbi:Ger(x)C family spore germination protein [Bacillus coahuilensis]|uniref:Ger(x)C family spore germination protein n=1 Tax=Bacillus coahuilensis TaxID=408580 RepID=UPI0001850A5E|nr:Ger(x)C family spore germination protein [Bacillus coahuilensis]
MEKRVGFISFVFFLASCVQNHELEQLGLSTAAGYDLEDDGRILGTLVLNQFDPLKKEAIQTVQSIGETSKSIRQSINLETSNKIVSGQLRVVTFGKELGEKGVISITDTLSRDSSIGTMIYLSVSKSRANELLRLKSPILSMGNYLSQLIEQNIESETIISCTLHEFLQAYYDPGRDPILPMMELRNGMVLADGLAIFQDDKVVGEINAREGFYIKLIRDKYDAGTTEIDIPVLDFSTELINMEPKKDEIHVVVDQIKSEAKIKLVDPNIPSFEVKIQLDCAVQEISEDIIFNDQQKTDEFQKLINKGMEKRLQNVLAVLQELNSDPIGFGMVYNAKVRGKELTIEEWRELYPQAQIKTEIDTRIVRTGIMD